MTHLKTIAIAAIITAVAGASLATSAQAENRKGTMPSRMMMKKHAMKSHMMKHHTMKKM